jgi:tRNA-splicing ligase RtcB
MNAEREDPSGFEKIQIETKTKMQDSDLSREGNQAPISRSTNTQGSGAGTIKTWLVGKLSASLTRRISNISQSKDVVRVAVMPDIHEGPLVPNGCVIASRSLIYPEAVGKDIGCGISAIQFSIPANAISTTHLENILHQLKLLVPSLKFPSSKLVSSLPDACSVLTLSNERLKRISCREGRLQLGTLGRGNHFVELQRDNQGMLWGMVHTGSRFMGEAISAFHLTNAASCPYSNLAYLDLTTDAGQAYLNDMQWAMTYATENRLLILNRIADLLEREFQAEVYPNTYIDCPHNFARLEEHFGEQLIVHRKSANSARAGELGIIPASMAAGSRIVTGRGESESLHSSSHGAGRVLSRRKAAESIPCSSLLGTMQGIVFQQDNLRALRDEAPAAYKNIKNVMRAQTDLVRTENILSTILNYKGICS